MCVYVRMMYVFVYVCMSQMPKQERPAPGFARVELISQTAPSSRSTIATGQSTDGD